MRLLHLLTNRIIIARPATTSGYKMAMTTVTATLANIQPGANYASELTAGVFGKAFRIFVEGGIDIQPGDRLRDEGTGDFYTVQSDGVTRRTMGSIDYTVVSVQKTKQ